MTFKLKEQGIKRCLSNMKIYFKDQQERLALHLATLRTRKVLNYDVLQLNEMVKTIPIVTSKAIEELDLSVIFSYHIFPRNILVFWAEWQEEQREMRVGDTIVQQIYMPPLQAFSQKVIIGSRVNRIIDEPSRKGFSYETLEGHVEQGISTFTIEQSASGIVFKIHTFSAPGNFLTNLVGSSITLAYRDYCAAQALKHVKKQLELTA